MTNQRAIDLLKDLEQKLDDYCELNDEGKTAFSKAITALELFGNSEHLPSAQPEIIRCKDCKRWDNSEGRPFGYCMAMKHGYRSENWKIGIYRLYKGDFYCADAERKTDE